MHAPCVFHPQAKYGVHVANAWGVGSNTSGLKGGSLVTLSLSAGEAITRVTLNSAGALALGYEVDWLQGIQVTTSTGRAVGFGCLADGAAATCSDASLSVTSSGPAGYPQAVLGEFWEPDVPDG